MTEETQQPTLEPGTTFKVKYANDTKEIEVLALSCRQKAILTDQVLEIQANKDGANPFRLALAGLALCVPKLTDEVSDTLNDTMVMEIMAACLQGQAVEVEGKKKSE